MKAKLSIILLFAAVISLATFFMMGYAMWQIEEKGEASFSPQSYDVTNVDGVTITNTKQLNPSVFSYVGETDSEKGTLVYTINTTNFETLYCTLEIKNYSVSEENNVLDYLRLDDILNDTQYEDGKISFVLENLTKNTNHTLQFTFNTKLIYHPLFNTTGYNLDGNDNITFVLTVYDGE